MTVVPPVPVLASTSRLADPSYMMPVVPIAAWAALAGLVIAVIVIKTLLRLAAVVALLVLAAVAWKQGWLGPGLLNGLADQAKERARDLAALGLARLRRGG